MNKHIRIKIFSSPPHLLERSFLSFHYAPVSPLSSTIFPPPPPVLNADSISINPKYIRNGKRTAFINVDGPFPSLRRKEIKFYFPPPPEWRRKLWSDSGGGYSSNSPESNANVPWKIAEDRVASLEIFEWKFYRAVSPEMKFFSHVFRRIEIVSGPDSTAFDIFTRQNIIILRFWSS